MLRVDTPDLLGVPLPVNLLHVHAPILRPVSRWASAQYQIEDVTKPEKYARSTRDGPSHTRLNCGIRSCLLISDISVG